jgi:hypothetical protein
MKCSWLFILFFCVKLVYGFKLFPTSLKFRVSNHLSRALTSLDDKTKPEYDIIPFSKLKDFYERCQRLSNLESEFMLSFWSDPLQCFQIVPNLDTNRVSVTTTCISLLTILHNPNHWKNKATWDQSSNRKISLRGALNSLLTAPWSNDLFQSQSLVLTLAQFKGCDKDDPRFLSAVNNILESRSKLSLHREQAVSTYLRYHNVLSLLALLDNQMTPTVLVGTHRLGLALDRANLVAFDELCRQLAFFNSGDSAQFDVIVLAYSLLAYWDSSNSLFLRSFARGVVPTTNMKLVKAALEVIFSSQASDGTWRKGEPINKVNGANSSRDIGNNYVFFFDLLGSLLNSIGLKQPTLLAPYLHNLERCVEWAETNIQQEMLPEQIDERTGRSYGRVVKGWRSNHLGNGGAVAWCTAHVFEGLSQMSKVTRMLITSSILAEFGGKVAPSSLLTGNNQDWKVRRLALR